MPGCLSIPANVLVENRMRTRRQLKALESGGMEPALLFLENYKRGVGSMSASAHNHNNRSPAYANPLGSVISDKHTSRVRKSAARWFQNSSPSVHQMSTRRKTNAGSDMTKKLAPPKQMETPKTSHISVAPACKSRALQTLKTPNGSGKQVATQCDTAPTNGKRRRGRPRKDSPPRNSDNGRNGCVSRPSCIRYSYPIPEPPNARNQCKAENRSTKSNGETGRCSQKRSVSPSSFTQTAKTVKRSRKRSAPSPSPSDIIKVVDYSPKRSPPSLSEEERSAAGVSSGYGNVGRSRHEGPPIAAIQRKRYLVEMFDSMLPTEICDGRVDLQELVNKMSRFLADLLDSAGLWDFQGRRDIDHNHHYMAEPSRALAPTSQIAFENLLTPTRRSYNLPYQPQNSSSNGGHLLDNVRMISEGREENYGLGAFQDANIRALLPNTPVYSAARLRNLVHSNGTAMTERENTEIVPVEKLDPHQLQLLQEKGFRLVTLDVPEDRRSLTNMQRMALADMCDENTTEKPKSMKY